MSDEEIPSDFDDINCIDGTRAKAYDIAESEEEVIQTDGLRLRAELGVPESISRLRVFSVKDSQTSDECLLSQSDENQGAEEKEKEQSSESEGSNTKVGLEDGSEDGEFELLSSARKAAIDELKESSLEARQSEKVWATLLASRVIFQPVLLNANKIDGPDKEGKAQETLACFLKRLSLLQLKLIAKNPKILKHVVSSKKRPSSDFWDTFEEIPKKLKTWIGNVLDNNWENSNVKLSRPSLSVLSEVPSKFVERAMSNDYERLVERSVVRNSSSSVCWDDSEIYFDLLKQTVDDPSADVSQTKRISKKKEGVNPRASKGRMIRYDSIPKLVGFMTAENAPWEEDSDAEKAVDQFMNSLFKF